MAYECGNCGPGGANYSTHDYEGHGSGGYTLDPADSKGSAPKYEDANKYDNDPAKDYDANDNSENEDEKKKKEEEKNKKPTIEDNIKKEEKKEEKDDDFKTTSQHVSQELLHQNKKQPELKKKKQHDNIDEAINKAINGEKKVVRLDY